MRSLLLLPLLAACADETSDATLARVQAEIFEPSCAFSSCHGAASGAGGLDLREGQAHAALVNVPSSASAGSTLVVPGDPDASYLVSKCTPDAEIVDARMPDGAEGLDDERLTLLRDWIAAGAPAE